MTRLTIAGAGIAKFLDDPFVALHFLFNGFLLEDSARSNLGTGRFPNPGAFDVAAFVAALVDATQVAASGNTEIFAFAFVFNLGDFLGLLDRSTDFARLTFRTTTRTFVNRMIRHRDLHPEGEA